VYGIGKAPDVIAGDYNGDASVAAADYVIWRKGLGQGVPLGTGADGNRNGGIDSGDYSVWRANFGRQKLLSSSPLSTESLPTLNGINDNRINPAETGGELAQNTIDQATARSMGVPIARHDEISAEIIKPPRVRRHLSNREGQSLWFANKRAEQELLSLTLSAVGEDRAAPSHSQLSTVTRDSLSHSVDAIDDVWDGLEISRFALGVRCQENSDKIIKILD
jgi:hypothetical protein